MLTPRSNRPEASTYTARLSLVLEMLSVPRLRVLKLCLNFEKRFSLYDHDWTLRKTIVTPFSKFLPDLSSKADFSICYSGGMERFAEMLQIRKDIRFHERPRLPYADIDDFVRSHTYNDPWRENDLRLALYCSSQASEDDPPLLPWAALPPPRIHPLVFRMTDAVLCIYCLFLSPFILAHWLWGKAGRMLKTG
jgi:hypothetical protein